LCCKEELHSCFSFKPRAEQGEAMHNLDLQLKYGVVRFLGTLHHNRAHHLIFQSDDPLEVMHQLQERCAGDDVEHGHMLIIKQVSS
jgi:hypothetical protein